MSAETPLLRRRLPQHFSTGGDCAPLGDTGQCLETLLVVGGAPGSSAWRPGILFNILHCAGESLTTRLSRAHALAHTLNNAQISGFQLGTILPCREHVETLSVIATGRALLACSAQKRKMLLNNPPVDRTAPTPQRWRGTHAVKGEGPPSKATMCHPVLRHHCYSQIPQLKKKSFKKNLTLFTKYYRAKVLQLCCRRELPGAHLKTLMPRLHHRPIKSAFLGGGTRALEVWLKNRSPLGDCNEHPRWRTVQASANWSMSQTALHLACDPRMLLYVSK